MLLLCATEPTLRFSAQLSHGVYDAIGNTESQPVNKLAAGAGETPPRRGGGRGVMLALILAAILTLAPGTLDPQPQPQDISGLGVGVPLQQTPAAEYPLADSTTWHNWHSDGCEHPGYWVMAYSPGDLERHPIPAECDNNPLLIGNEWEGRTDTPVAVAVEILHQFRDHSAPVYCCGSLVWDRGFWYTISVLAGYYIEYKQPPPVTGLHIHPYDTDPHQLRKWKRLADVFGWEIVVSEYNCGAESPQAAADCMPDVSAELVELLDPVALFWFSWQYDGFTPNTDLVDEAGEWTVVGAAWLDLAQVEGAGVEYTVYLPGVVR